MCGKHPHMAPFRPHMTPRWHQHPTNCEATNRTNNRYTVHKKCDERRLCRLLCPCRCSYMNHWMRYENSKTNWFGPGTARRQKYYLDFKMIIRSVVCQCKTLFITIFINREMAKAQYAFMLYIYGSFVYLLLGERGPINLYEIQSWTENNYNEISRNVR